MSHTWVGWESNRLLPTLRPTLWNRTRTSRASAERADQLRQSGMSRRAPVVGERAALSWVPAWAPVIIIIALRLSQNLVQPCAARTSGLDASANIAGAPLIVWRPRAPRAQRSPHEIRSRDS